MLDGTIIVPFGRILVDRAITLPAGPVIFSQSGYRKPDMGLNDLNGIMQHFHESGNATAPPVFPVIVTGRDTSRIGMVNIIEITAGTIGFQSTDLIVTDHPVQLAFLRDLAQSATQAIGVFIPADIIQVDTINIIIIHNFHGNIQSVITDRCHTRRQSSALIHGNSALVAADPVRMFRGRSASMEGRSMKCIKPGMNFDAPLMGFFNHIGQWVIAGITVTGIITPWFVGRVVISCTTLPCLPEDCIHIGRFMIIKNFPNQGFILVS